MATTAAGTPYVESSDLVANYPGVSLALATHIDTIGKIRQVVTSIYTSFFSTTSTSYVNTPLTVSITPSKTTSKVLVFATGIAGNTGTGGNGSILRIVRGASTELTVVGAPYRANEEIYAPWLATVLDSPSTTSSTSYTVQIASQGASNAALFNLDYGLFGGETCTMYAIEVAA